MPLASTCLSSPPRNTSVASGHSFAALSTPCSAPSTAMTIILCTPHSLRVLMAAAEVPPVAIMGSIRIASVGAEELEVVAVACVGMWYGRLL